MDEQSKANLENLLKKAKINDNWKKLPKMKIEVLKDDKTGLYSFFKVYEDRKEPLSFESDNLNFLLLTLELARQALKLKTNN